MDHDWTRADSTKCSVCGETRKLVFVRGFMMCEKHDNAETLDNCDKLREAQLALQAVNKSKEKPKWKDPKDSGTRA